MHVDRYTVGRLSTRLIGCTYQFGQHYASYLNKGTYNLHNTMNIIIILLSNRVPR